MFLYHQAVMPGGWPAGSYNGPWPEGGCWVIKLLIPPNMKTWRTAANWHIVTLFLAHGANPNNHMMLGPLLQRLFSHHCDCLSGSRTNSACSHVCAAVIALFAPQCFKTTKVMEPRLSDPQR